MTPEAIHILAISQMLHFDFGYLKILANLNLHFEAVPTLRVYGSPYDLQDALCTLRLDCSQDFTRSASDATLDTGGWINLTGQGLAPCKVYQAQLGTLTKNQEVTLIVSTPLIGSGSTQASIIRPQRTLSGQLKLGVQFFESRSI